MPPNLAAYAVTKDDFLEQSRNILYEFTDGRHSRLGRVG